MIGRLMAKKNSLKIGDTITIRWRDANGTFDATDGEIVVIMQSNVPTIDQGQIWVPLKKMEEMYNIRGEATIVTIRQNTPGGVETPGWVFRDHAYLLKDLNDIIKSKRAGSSFIYIILLFLAMLAIFDTQILSIFRRRKEIGTLMALGMIRTKVIMLFTLEGLMHGILGIAMAALYGIPVLILTSRTGIPLPGAVEGYGYAISTRLFPTYSPFLVGITVLIVMITVTIVSYLPSRRIARMEPTEALKGKLS
jgi:ABC-type lipoprotein release transport system permease subunit